ncbi:MAG: S46 family peptidase [Chitinophagaceae bacterium]|nr:S46 family peptidase [Chitinophagaceae bacterium]
MKRQMKKMGMKISAADIYSISKGSLKDAIVSFGGFVLPIISDQGLLLTNHHCGFDACKIIRLYKTIIYGMVLGL